MTYAALLRRHASKSRAALPATECSDGFSLSRGLPIALVHISYFACRSMRCHRALRKLNVCTPPAEALISCDG